MLFFLPLVLLLGACQLIEAPTHITYTYTITSLPKSRMTNGADHAYSYRAGEQVALTWEAHQDKETQETKPQVVSIDAGLVGPFSTVNELKSAMSFDNNNVIDGRIAVVVPPIQTDNWTDKAVKTDLQLPTVPGYYMLVQRILVGKQGPPYPVPTGQIISVVK
jgi:hypothetical protein